MHESIALPSSRKSQAFTRFGAYAVLLSGMSSAFPLSGCCFEDNPKNEHKSGEWVIVNAPQNPQRKGNQGADGIDKSLSGEKGENAPKAAPENSAKTDPGSTNPEKNNPELSSACPKGFAFIESQPIPVCMQRWESQIFYKDGKLHDPFSIPPLPKDMTDLVARSSPGVIPQGYLELDQARIACENTEIGSQHLRLCSMEEWKAACKGVLGKLFPYGSDGRTEGKCNTHKFPGPDHLVLRFHPDTKWTTSDMNDFRINQVAEGLAKGGAYSECTNSYQVMDMVGNLQEAVGTIMVKVKEKEYEYVSINDAAIKSGDKKGNAIWMGDHYMGQGLNYNGCEARDTAHAYVPMEHWKNQFDYSRGFRCCMDIPNPKR